MFESILVGFRDTEHGGDALALGELIARSVRASLTAARVYVFHPIHREGDAEFERLLAEDSREQIVAAESLATDPAPSLVVARGHSATEGLHRLAAESGADLVVVGSSHHGATGRVLARGTAEKLLHDAPCAVAIAPRGYRSTAPHRLTTIGVGFDGGPEAWAALTLAADLARATGARLHVIAVLDPAISFLAPRPLAELAYLEYEMTARRQLHETLTNAVEQLSDIDAVAAATDGPVAEALTTASQELDLLVLGSRCYGPVRRVLLGSVSTTVLRQATCPVLVVPRTTVDSTQIHARGGSIDRRASRSAIDGPVA